MEHQISYAALTHLVRIPASDILELAGTTVMPENPYVSWHVNNAGEPLVQVSWVEEIDPDDYIPASLIND